MELRHVNMDGREILGAVQVWDEVSYLVPDPGGERVKRGAFAKSIAERATRVPLCIAHNHERAVGMSKQWTDDTSGLSAVFGIRPGELGDQALEDARDGYLPGLSVGFWPVRADRARDGVLEVREARLMEVSLVLIGAYDGSRVMAVRHAQSVEELLKPFANPPHVDLSPIPPIWG
jgi:HK97 family phage prohead protease